MTAIKSVIAMLVALLLIDAIWIATFMQGLYEREIGGMLKAEPNAIAALIFYIGYPVGAYILCVKPAFAARSWQPAALNGAVLGGAAYGTFAVTNLAVLQGWSVTLTVVDSLWGMFVTGLVATLGYLAGGAAERRF